MCHLGDDLLLTLAGSLAAQIGEPLLDQSVQSWVGVLHVDELDGELILGNAEKLHRTGTLFAAGMITGEALMGILIAIPIVVTERADALALPASLQFGKIVGLGVFAVLAFWLYRTAVAKRSMP